MKYDILRIEPQTEPIYLIVPSMDFDLRDDAEYFYEEKKCPSDTLKSVVAVIIEGDADPHGIIGYVRTTEGAEISGPYNPSALWPSVAPEAFEPPAAPT